MRRLLAIGSLLFVVLPAGIAVAAVKGGGGTGGGEGRVVTVELTAHHSRFTPATVEAPPGATVRFVVRNLDPIDHELIVGGPAVHRRHEVGREAHHHGEMGGEISVPAGATATTEWRVPADAAGSVLFACHLPGHFAYGMSGRIVVS